MKLGDAKYQPHLVVKNRKGEVETVITPKDFQVGFEGNPGALILKGALDINSTNVIVNNSSEANIKISNDIIAYFIKNNSTSGITVNLPTPPAHKGQLHIIKDYKGNANTYVITIQTTDNSTIDGQAAINIDVDYGGVMFVWTGSEWVSLSLGSVGAGAGAAAGLKFVTWGTEASLPNSRVIDAVSGETTSTIGGSQIVIGLANTGTAGTYAYPSSITTDAKGRITSITAGSPSGAPANATYVVLSNDATLTNERALAVTSNLTITDAGANSTVTLDLSNTGTAGTYAYPASITTDAKGRVTSVTAGSAGPPVNATYIVISNDATLTNERALATDGSITITDGGANNSVTLGIDDDIVATVSGTIFTGRVIGQLGFTGSITKLSDGRSYLAADGGIQIVSESNGQIVFTNTAISSSYIVISNDTTLTNERALAVTSNLTITDGGANNSVTLDLSNTGSAGTYIFPSSITIDSKGRVSSTTAGVIPAPITASYIVISNDPTLTNERALAVNSSLLKTDAGANSTITLGINDNVVATVSGTIFTGRVIGQLGLSGSLTKLHDGTSYLVAGSGIQITSQSNGQVTITNTGAVGTGSSSTTQTWIDGVDKLRTTASVAISAGTIFANDIGSDVYFYVSGTQGGLGTSSGRISVFGGDVVLSSSLNFHTTSIYLTSHKNIPISISTFYVCDRNNGYNLFQISNETTGSLFSVSNFDDGIPIIDIFHNNKIVISGSVYFGSGTSTVVNPTYIFFSGTQRLLGANEKIVTFGGDVRVSGGLVVDSTVATPASDVYFYVSGTQGGLGTSSGRISVFGGDVVLSSSLNFHTTSIYLTSHKNIPISISTFYVCDRNNGYNLFQISNETTGSLFSVSNFDDGIPIIDIFHNNKIVISGSVYFGSGTSTVVNPTYIFFSGTQGLVGANDRSIVFAGDVRMSGGLFVGNTITPPYVYFSGTQRLFGSNEKIPTFGGDIHVTGGMYLGANTNNIYITSSTSDLIFYDVLNSSGLTLSSLLGYWINGGNKLRTTSSVAISAGTIFADNIGSDVYFYVSGTQRLGGAAGRVSTFGGDVQISGGLGIGLTKNPPYVYISGTQGLFGANERIATFGGDVRISGALIVDSTVATPPSDVYFYVSGTKFVSGSSAGRVSVFGGDLFISGATRFMGGHIRNLVTVTGSYYLDRNDCVIAVAGPGTATPITIFTPTQSIDIGTCYIIKDKNGNCTTGSIIISASLGATIDGTSNYTMAINYASIEIIKLDATKWGII